MTKSQPVTTIAKAFGLFGKLLRTTEDKGVTMAHWQKPIDDIRARKNLAEYLKAGCPKINIGIAVASSEGENLARSILGDDLVTPDDIEATTDVSYTNDQKAHAAETMPTDPKVLKSIKADNCMLIWGPAQDMTLADIHSEVTYLFFSDSDAWYLEDREKFSRTDTVCAGKWLIIRKSPVDGSTSKNWDEQQNMVVSGNRVPNAAEITYAVITYFRVRSKYLLSDVYVRTSSVDADGGHVIVGYFVGDGLSVNNYWFGNRDSYVGVAAARD